MTAKEYLKQVYLLDKRIDSGLRELVELRALATSVTPTASEERVQTSPSGEAPFTRALSRIWELENTIDEEIDRLVDLKVEIRSVINEVSDCDQQMILRYRYIHFCSWEDIAGRMGYGLRWIHLLHGKALAAVEEILSEKV